MDLPDAPTLLGIAAIITSVARLVAAWRADKARSGADQPGVKEQA